MVRLKIEKERLCCERISNALMIRAAVGLFRRYEVQKNAVSGRTLGSCACKIVEYDEPSLLNYDMLKILTDKDSDFFSELFHRKAMSWKYENEWRLVYLHKPDSINNNRISTRKLNADLTSITFGVNANYKDIEAITNIFKLKNRPIDFYKMEPMSGRLEVRPKLLFRIAL